MGPRIEIICDQHEACLCYSKYYQLEKVPTVNASGQVVGHLTILCCSTLTQPTRVDTLLVLARLLGGTFAAASTPNTQNRDD